MYTYICIYIHAYIYTNINKYRYSTVNVCVWRAIIPAQLLRAQPGKHPHKSAL